MQCQVCPYFLSNSFLMYSATSLATVCFSNPYFHKQEKPPKSRKRMRKKKNSVFLERLLPPQRSRYRMPNKKKKGKFFERKCRRVENYELECIRSDGEAYIPGAIDGIDTHLLTHVDALDDDFGRRRRVSRPSDAALALLCHFRWPSSAAPSMDGSMSV